ncbi:unnamed protein product [Nippostrongylus brasiliensis]|uniref:RECA_2 domain-containing protein n=1 Tax=Nippostrongylus brasiliensis TaxID=27835 RepID=A0A0N4XS29_NIPBR|nr:unnamed protein product [Nippostrongylus brasiliensis]
MKTTFSVVWLDSNGSFRASRLMRFLEGDEPSGKGEDSSLLLDRVHVARIADQVQLSSALQYIDDNFEAERIRLVVIDSVHEMFDDRLLNDYTGSTHSLQEVFDMVQ